MRRTCLIVIMLVTVLAVGGCANGRAAAEQKCFSNEKLVEMEMRLFNADTGMEAPFQSVLEKAHAVCPSGGTYSLDPVTGLVTCSVHGHY